MTPALHGLVLAGGASQRMQRDKATLDYHGKPQLLWAFDLLREMGLEAFVSVRPDQSQESLRASLPQIVDRKSGIGPLAGIDAALARDPRAAWLVVACDLPHLTREVLQHLIAHRDDTRIATAYRSRFDGLPEPLCAIWEPTARAAVDASLQQAKSCPRKLLMNSDIALLDLPDAKALDNINTPDELAATQSALSSPSPTL